MSWYVKELKKLTAAMTKECERELTGIYKRLDYQVEIAQDESISSQVRIALNALREKYGDKFTKKAKKLVEQLLRKTNRYSNTQINRALKDMVGDKASGFALVGSAITPEKSEVMKALIFENVSLIRSISDEYFKQITGAVARSIESGTGLKELSDELMTFGAKSKRRADLIAQDQTRKAYTAINLRNFDEAGIKKFKWMHSGGSREPREYHMKDYPDGLNGGVFDIDDPPIINEKTKERGYPGQLPYCRCTMTAVLDFED